MAAARTVRRRPAPPGGIRWDRIGRIALLCVLGLVLYLYIGPTRSWIATWHQSKARTAELHALQRQNARLRAQAAALRNPAALEAQARSLGMVRPSEKPYVIRGLPK